MNNINKNRDIFLDVAKGFAIMLVVLGHIFQSMHREFDEFMPFKIIYSFHMPMFFCLSGMVASLKIHSFFPKTTIREEFFRAKNELINATKRLLVPFISWTVASFFIFNYDGNMTFLKNVLKSPDWSLWFLLALFYCRIFFQAIRSSAVICRIIIEKITRINFFIIDNHLFSITVFIVSFLILRKYAPIQIPGLHFLIYYFPFYVLGLYMYKYKEYILINNVIPIFCIITFCLLSPFWSRTTSGEIEIFISEFIGKNQASIYFRYTVALCGTVTFLWAVNVFTKRVPPRINAVVAFIGSMTLGIYALHYHFLSIPPVFVGALVASIFATYIIKQIRIFSFLFLGEKRPHP